MTLQIYDDLEQRSDEWYEARRGILTASAIGKLITPKTVKPAANDHSRGLTAELAGERITGRTEFFYPSRDMQRGIFDEPFARDAYANHFHPVTEAGFMVRTIDGHRIGYSPDGLVGDDGLIEIKSRAPKTHLATILADEVPAENMAQIQAGLLVTGRAWCDYISFSAGMRLYVKRVAVDPRWQDVITTVLAQFEAKVADHLAKYEAATVGMPDTEYFDPFEDIEIEIE